MHEAVIFQRLRAAIQAVSAREAVRRFVRARVRVGALSHVPAERLRAEWAAIVGGTSAEGSELLLETSDDVRDPHAADVMLVSLDAVDDPIRADSPVRGRPRDGPSPSPVRYEPRGV